MKRGRIKDGGERHSRRVLLLLLFCSLSFPPFSVFRRTCIRFANEKRGETVGEQKRVGNERAIVGRERALGTNQIKKREKRINKTRATKACAGDVDGHGGSFFFFIHVRMKDRERECA